MLYFVVNKIYFTGIIDALEGVDHYDAEIVNWIDNKDLGPYLLKCLLINYNHHADI